MYLSYLNNFRCVQGSLHTPPKIKAGVELGLTAAIYTETIALEKMDAAVLRQAHEGVIGGGENLTSLRNHNHQPFLAGDFLFLPHPLKFHHQMVEFQGHFPMGCC